MTFHYYIIDLENGNVVGTDDLAQAEELRFCEDYIVIDTKTGEWLISDGTMPIEELRTAPEIRSDRVIPEFVIGTTTTVPANLSPAPADVSSAGEKITITAHAQSTRRHF